MNSWNDKRKKPDKSYGRKPYVIVNSENDTYNDMMTTIPRKSMMDQRLEKKSRFDKPYLEDNYNDMEYGEAPQIPSFSNPDFNFPEVPGPVPTDNELPAPWAWPPCILSFFGPWYCGKCDYDKDFVSQAEMFFLMLRDGYFPGGIIRAQALAAAQTTIYHNGHVYGDVDKRTSGYIKINEPTGGWSNGDKLSAITWCRDENGTMIKGCSADLEISCRDNDCCYCPPEVEFAYDNDTSAETIVRENTCPVAVNEGGGGPYSWSVAGTGFSIPSNTDELTNTLSADETACGTATITVTDCCGAAVTGYVRCTTGRWNTIVGNCGASNCPQESPIGDTTFSYYVDGYQRWIVFEVSLAQRCVETTCNSVWLTTSAACGEHPPPCGSPMECAQAQGSWCPPGGHPSYTVEYFNRYKYQEWECS